MICHLLFLLYLCGLIYANYTTQNAPQTMKYAPRGCEYRAVIDLGFVIKSIFSN